MNEINRRKFIGKSGLALTGLAVGFPAIAKNFASHSANDKVNLAVIGAGSRGRGLMKIMQDVPSIQMVAACDVRQKNLDKAKELIGKGAKGYVDYRKLLEDKDVDAVLISTPLSMHSQMAIDALDAGKHVYCEKTMAYDAAQALAMVSKSKENKDLIFQTGHQYHSSRLYTKVVDLIKEGNIGKVMGFECQWNRNGDWRRKVDDPKNERLINWRMYREYSKGLLAELSSHQIDFANWVTDSHPESVIGSGGIDYWKDGRETYDNTRVIFNYPGGVKATYTCLTFNSYSDYRIKVFGDEATLFLGYDDARAYLEGKKKKELGVVDGVSGATIRKMMAEDESIEIKSDNMDPSKQALVDFADSIRNNTEPISNIQTGAKASFAVSMALDAIMTDKRVYWKDEYNV
ncbi:Gfo/Idh/MocA family oxidoreductase [Flammeovirgaceae bacterium SG7u.111]|nr:Gfo/Idh/MocA family oxidoreductase [Flammeovirgaceae bacterium SG7u.132]WPO36276.1 Gfo/Idh/MocA family oxidoreductase [Flammeovirgaceae bacterium SG7u.111]